MAEDITTETTPTPRKFKDRKEYLDFLAEQKALKDKEIKGSAVNIFGEFDAEKDFNTKKEKSQKNVVDSDLRPILIALKNNNKLSTQILAKLNQKIVKESTLQSSKKNDDISSGIEGLNNRIDKMWKIVDALRVAIIESPISNIHGSQSTTNNQIAQTIDASTNRQEKTNKIIEYGPQYITNIRQYQYKRNPHIRRKRGDSIASGIGRRIGTHIGGRSLGNIIAKSIRAGETVTGNVIKLPFKLASKTIKYTTNRSSRDTLIKTNRIAETSKFRKKMLELLGIISKKEPQTASIQSPTTSSNGLSNLLKLGGAAALAGGVASMIPAIKERFTKNEDGTFGPDHKGGTEIVKKLASSMAEMATKTLKSFGQGMKEAADKHILEFAENNYKKFNEIKSKIEDFGKNILESLTNIINGVYDKISNVSGKIADTAMEGANAIYNAPKNIADFAANTLKESPLGKLGQRIHNKGVANNRMPDYKGGNISETSNLADKIVVKDDYNNIANSLYKSNTSPTLKQLETQQKQADVLQMERDKKANQPIVINSTTNNTKETQKQQPSIVRLGTRNLDSSKQQLDRSTLSGGYMGVGFLVN